MFTRRALKAPFFVGLLFWAGLAGAQDLEPSCAFERALCGYVDGSGKVAIPPAFDAAERFRKGHAVVKRGGQYGIIDETGAFAAPPEYQGATILPGGELLLFRDGISRLLDQTGRPMAEAEAQVIRPLDADHVLIGEDIPSFDPARLDLVDFERAGTWRIRTLSTGQETAPVASEIGLISDEPGFPFWQSVKGDYFLTAPDGRRLTGALGYGGGYARGLIVAAKDGRWGFIDREGRTKIDFRFDWVAWFGNDEWTTFRVGPYDKAKYGYIDQTGKIVIPARFDEALPFSGDLADVTLNGARITIDRSGQRAGPCENAFLARQTDGGFRLFRADGAPLNDEIYAYAQVSCGEPTLIETKDGRSGFLDDQGALLGDRYYRRVLGFNDGIAVVWQDEIHAGIIDEAGDFIVAPVLTGAHIISHGSIDIGNGSVTENLVINPGPNEVILTAEVARALARDPSLLTTAPPEPPDIFCPADGVDIVEKDGTIAYIDSTGKPFIEGAFDFATCFYRRDRVWVAVRDRREWCEFDKSGQMDEATCRCEQPVVIIESVGELGSEATDGLDCYDAGLKIVGPFSQARPQQTVRPRAAPVTQD